MIKLMQTTSLAALILLSSGCSNLNNNLGTANEPNIDETLEVISDASIKSLSDITSIAFEWKSVNDHRVTGYNFYRANMHKDGRRLKLIDSINNKYSTHYVDKNLEPNTKYVYQISSKASDGKESKTTNAYIAQTAPRIAPVSFMQALSDLPNRIKVIWRPHEDKSIAYYVLERFNTSVNNWEKLSKIEGRLESEYIDDGLDNNESFRYRIKAFTYNDVATVATEAVSAKTKPLPKGVTDLTASNDKPKSINLTWTASKTEDVIKYEIERSNLKTFGFTKLKEVNNETLAYTDAIDQDGAVYFYKVFAVDKDNLRSSVNTDSVKGVTLNKPAKPNITLAQIQGSKAILNWTSGDHRAMSYNIYKRTKINFFTYKTESFKDIKELRYEDNNIISGVEYKYSIQANDEYGLISERTDEAALILPQTKILK